jgi:hypothetical protein
MRWCRAAALVWRLCANGLMRLIPGRCSTRPREATMTSMVTATPLTVRPMPRTLVARRYPRSRALPHPPTQPRTYTPRETLCAASAYCCKACGHGEACSIFTLARLNHACARSEPRRCTGDVFESAPGHLSTTSVVLLRAPLHRRACIRAPAQKQSRRTGHQALSCCLDFILAQRGASDVCKPF